MLSLPTDVCIDDNINIYLLDASNYHVQRFLSNSTIGTTVINGSDGNSLNQFGSCNVNQLNSASEITGVCGSGLDQLCYPISVTLDQNKNIFIADGPNAHIMRWTVLSSVDMFVIGVVIK
ncbi:hypothetical protein I4U23_004650 [Adineta vaga]|nr:hypothetical protein I4U23_004650 [Adineta vaga]